MSTIPIVVKHGGQKHSVDVDPSSTGEVFKYQLFSLTGVEPDRQKVLVKGGQLKDDTPMSSLSLKPGQALMMMGTPAAKAIQAPKEKTKFLEEMSEAERARTEGATPSGLQNLGNTCYLNSTLQALRFVPELQAELASYRSDAASGPAAFGNLGGGSSLLAGFGGMSGGGDLTGALRDLYRQMGDTTEGFPPLKFLSTLRAAFPQFAEKTRDGHYSQQDAEECYSQIITQLRSKLKVKNEEGADISFVDKYLAGKMVTTMTCDEPVGDDEPPVETEESFVNLKCHISVNTNHLRDGLLAGLAEKIEKHSPSLGREAVYTKTSRITRLPKYLTCHFVRFFWKREINKKAKIMRKVTFPFELDASEFCTDAVRGKLIPVRDRLRDLRKDALDRERARKRLKKAATSPDDIAGGNAGGGGFGSGPQSKALDEAAAAETEAAKRKLAEEEVTDWGKELEGVVDPEMLKDEGCNPSGLYDLMGVITHQGASADSGHYCSYVKKEGDDGRTWYFFNDDKVSEVDQDKIEGLAGGGESHSALILLYRAVPLTAPPPGK